ncbi:hypothetical protein ACH5A2_40260 [Streptomyces collinus]|uniref:hypothetical protein n=1 Tax=Streptomyces collinus TaxID=42684 RepID=UPI0037912145
MSNKVKMSIFLSVVAVVTVLALLQGLTAEGSNKALPLLVAALGVASLGMDHRGPQQGQEEVTGLLVVRAAVAGGEEAVPGQRLKYNEWSSR